MQKRNKFSKTHYNKQESLVQNTAMKEHFEEHDNQNSNVNIPNAPTKKLLGKDIYALYLETLRFQQLVESQKA